MISNMKTKAIITVICFIGVTKSLEIVNCNPFLDWSHSNDHVNDWGTYEAEAGKVCRFNVTEINSHWRLSETFSCGTNKLRVVMCEKAFNLFKKVQMTF